MLENARGEAARVGPPGAASGFVAALVALAFLWALSRAAPSVAFPPLALAERIVRLAPGDAATVAIERLGHTAILLLAGGIVAAFLVLGALLPALLRGRLRERGRWAAASFGAPCAVAVLLDPVGPVFVVSLVAVVGAALLYAVVLEWATSAIVTGPADPGAGVASRAARDSARRLPCHRRRWHTPGRSSAASSSSWRHRLPRGGCDGLMNLRGTFTTRVVDALR